MHPDERVRIAGLWESALGNITDEDWVVRFEDAGNRLLSEGGVGEVRQANPVASDPSVLDQQSCCEDNGFMANLNLEGLNRGDRIAMVLRAWNHAGLVSAPFWTNGMVLGKNEMVPSDTETTAMGFDMVCTSDECQDGEDGSSAPATTGGIVVPPGAVQAPPGSKIEAGVIDEDEVESDPDVVDPLKTTAPRNNLKFDGYSFTIKMKDSNGSEIEGFQFDKPIVLSFAYDVGSLLDRLQKDDDPSV